MSLSIIVATDIYGGIGKGGDLPFYIPEDLKRFKELTSNHTIIMGRKTFESLPNGLLPNRFHIVLTKDKYNYYNQCRDKYDMTKLHICDDINFLIDEYKKSEDEVFIIGGGEIYKQFLPYCNEIYTTSVYINSDADTYFEWGIEGKNFVTYGISDKLLSKSGLEYRFVNLARVVNGEVSI